MSKSKNIRIYGRKPFRVAVIHGGPGAAGGMAPVARELSKSFGVLEPFQTKSSITGQIRELHAILNKHAEFPVVLIGHSWGAWLSFIFAARYPKLVKKLVLVGSGPFEERYVSRIGETRLRRLNSYERVRQAALLRGLEVAPRVQKQKLFSQLGKLFDKADSYTLMHTGRESLKIRFDIYERVWREAARLRGSGKLLKLGKRIICPVVVIHGVYDPHPFLGVQIPLSHVIKSLRCVRLSRCGHTPWKERFARRRFYKLLHQSC